MLLQYNSLQCRDRRGGEGRKGGELGEERKGEREGEVEEGQGGEETGRGEKGRGRQEGN